MTAYMDSVRERFTEYLDKMFNEFGFGYVAEEGYSNAEDALYQWDGQDDMANHYGLWFDCGATRIVIGDEHDDYIIKFQTDRCGVDYGSIEAWIYADAKEQGFESKFVFCEKLLDYVYTAEDGAEYIFPIYVYERVYCSYDTISDDSYDYHYRSFCEQEELDPELDESRDRYYREDGRYSGSAEMMEFAQGALAIPYILHAVQAIPFLKRCSYRSRYHNRKANTEFPLALGKPKTLTQNRPR